MPDPGRLAAHDQTMAEGNDLLDATIADIRDALATNSEFDVFAGLVNALYDGEHETTVAIAALSVIRLAKTPVRVVAE